MSNGDTDLEKLAVPSEIPWQLLTTTRTLDVSRFPSGSSVSIFYYLPKLKSLDNNYPDDRVIYFKISVSIAPDLFMTTTDTEDARFLLEGGEPVWTSVLDLSLSPPPVAKGGGIRPYFIEAAPLRRVMLETGIVGDDVYEGEAEGVAYGKSATQMHESFLTSTRTTTKSLGGGIPFIFSASKGTTSTSVTGQRDIVQVEDTTSRQASEERRELLSHMTNVNNVLTLLSARDLGTPHLRFTLRPQPLRLLTIDPTDPNLWYAELLRRRSSGIQGIQDYYTIAMVPRSMKRFCLNASLRNVNVLDKPPKPPLWGQMTYSSEVHTLRYLSKKYPHGTPIDDLDVDITSHYNLKEGEKLIQPVVEGFATMSNYGSKSTPLEAKWVSVNVRGIIRRSPGWETSFKSVPYKTFREVDLERQNAEYLAALSRSPLERGIVFYVPITLNVCLKQSEDGKVSMATHSRSIGIPKSIDFDMVAIQPVGGSSNALTGPFRKAWITWDALDKELESQLSIRGDWKSTDLRADQEKVMNVLMERLQDLSEDDPSNESIKNAARWLRLQPRQIEMLYSAGVTDLRSLASALNAIELTAQINSETQRLTEMLSDSEEERLKPGRIEVPFSIEEANSIRDKLAVGLQNRFKRVFKSTVSKHATSGKVVKEKIEKK